MLRKKVKNVLLFSVLRYNVMPSGYPEYRLVTERTAKMTWLLTASTIRSSGPFTEAVVKSVEDGVVSAGDMCHMIR